MIEVKKVKNVGCCHGFGPGQSQDLSFDQAVKVDSLGYRHLLGNQAVRIVKREVSQRHVQLYFGVWKVNGNLLVLVLQVQRQQGYRG